MLLAYANGPPSGRMFRFELIGYDLPLSEMAVEVLRTGVEVKSGRLWQVVSVDHVEVVAETPGGSSSTVVSISK